MQMCMTLTKSVHPSSAIEVLAERLALLELAPGAVQLLVDEVHWVEHAEAAQQQKTAAPQQEAAQAQAAAQAQLLAETAVGKWRSG
jgi:hypothetical protein